MNNIGFDVRLPTKERGLSQSEEYCIVVREGVERKIRFHDYREIYEVPGLYEHLFYHTLKCASHDKVSSLLVQEVDKTDLFPSDLYVLELGAGNGLVAEELARRGVETIVGADIIAEAAEAARRDRPNLYEKYYVKDFCNLDSDTRRELEAADFNCMVCVAALGFGDIPPSAFAQAYNLVADGGWVAFNIKEEFVEETDWTGFAMLIKRIVNDGTFELNVAQSYCHRLSTTGEPLTYVAIVGRKRSDISEEMVATSEEGAEARA